MAAPARVVRRGALLGVALVFSLAGVAQAKSYSFPRVSIDATVRPDGSLDLVEQRTFHFEGDFHYAYFTIAWPFDQIRDFRVTENGRRLRVDETNEGTYKATWYYSAEDEDRTFTISYTALCAVDVFSDTAHLNWQFIGTGWDVPTDAADVTVHLPPVATGRIERAAACPFPEEPGPAPIPSATRPLRSGEVRAWGHGPLGGEVRIPDPQTVELTIHDLEPNTFVEGSILFPEETVPLAPQVPIEMRQTILNQERSQAEAANRARRELLAEERSHDRWRLITWILLIGIPVAFVLLTIVSRIRDRVPGVPKVVREPPEDIHPVELAELWGTYQGRSVQRNTYRAQLLHLASRGLVDIQAVGPVSDPDDFIIRPGTKRATGLDHDFLEFLFPDGQAQVSVSDLKGTGERRTALVDWWKQAEEKGRKGIGPHFRGGGRWESRIATLLGFGAMVMAFVLPGLADTGLPLFLLAVGGIGLPITLVKIRPRFGREFSERMARWAAFRRFLTSFSELDDAPALAVVIWERYLTYATALGVADEVEKQVKALVPVEKLPSPWQGAPTGIQGVAWLSTINAAPAASPVTVTSGSSWSTSSGIGSFSSGGGFGGGFSGGGGGGGGGTGGGAG